VDLVRRGAASVWFVDGKRGRHARRLLRAARRAKRSRFGLWRTCPGTALDPAHGVETDAARR
jgi:endonuclease YncB( thermonuclease family)